MPLTIDDLKKAPREVLYLVELAKDMEDIHNARRGFFPTLVSQALTNPNSSLRKALADFKKAMDTASPILTDAIPTADVHIALKNLNDIYESLDRGKVHDIAEPFFQLPSYFRALQQFLEPSMVVVRQRNREESERKRQAVRDAMTQEEKNSWMNFMMEPSPIFNANGGGRKGRGRSRRSSKRIRRTRRHRRRVHS